MGGPITDWIPIGHGTAKDLVSSLEDNGILDEGAAELIGDSILLPICLTGLSTGRAIVVRLAKP
jgi:hypothetical protein